MELAFVWLKKGQWYGEYLLDDKTVTGISPYLTIPGKVVGEPHRLAANQNESFIGSFISGNGFILDYEEAQSLIKKYPQNRNILFPYLGGEDFNSRPDQSPSRWVINFHDWALNKDRSEKINKNKKGKNSSLISHNLSFINTPCAADYPDCLKIVEEKVKPEREKNNDKTVRELWWRFKRLTLALYEAIAGRDRVLFHSFTSKYLCFGFAPTGIVYAGPHVVVALSEYKHFAILQGIFHETWIYGRPSTMRNDLRYTPSDYFETFPFPESTTNLETIGETYYNHRQAIMQTRQEGLTKTYNRFHDPAETSEDIIKLRQLHVEMDYAVAQAYGWDDLNLAHGFYETKLGVRYTISETIRREILDRLLQFNFDRYAEEVAQGLHDKKKGKGKRKKGKKASGQGRLF